MKKQFGICEFSLLTMMLVGVTPSLLATNANWYGGTNTDFNNANNWIGVFVPSSTDYAYFNGNLVTTVRFTVDVNESHTIQSLFFANASTNPGSLTININNGGALVIAAGGDPPSGNGAQNSSGFTQTVNVNTGGTLTFNSNAMAGGSVQTGQLVNYVLAGTTGPGAIVFNNSSTAGGGNYPPGYGNTYGNFSGNQGIINFNTNSNAGFAHFNHSSSSVTINFTGSSTAGSSTINLSNGAKINFSGSSSALSSTITLNGAGTNLDFQGSSKAGSATINPSNGSNVTFETGTDALTSTITLDASNLNFQGTATAGSSTISLSNVSTATFSTGATGASSTITLNASTLNIFSNTSIGSVKSTDAMPNLSFIDLNTNTLTLGSNNTSDSLNALISSTGGFGNIIKNGTGTLTLGGTNTYSTSTIIQKGTVAASTPSNLGANSATIIFDPGSTGSTSSVLDLSSTGMVTFPQPVSISSAFTAQIAVTNALANVNLSGQITGGGFLDYVGPGTLILSSGSNSYSGGTSITSGTLSVGAAGNLGSGSINIVGSGILQSTGTFSVSDLISLNAGSTIDVASGQNLTISSVISGVGGSLTKTSAGTLTLSGVNTYSDGTIITAGTLSASAAGNLSSGNISIGGSGILQSTGTFSISNLINLFAGSTIDVASGKNFTITSVISGVGSSLTKTSTGTLTLTGTNTYNSGTTITAGTLSVSAASNLSSGNVSIGGSGTLQSTGTFSASNLISLNAGSTIDVASSQNFTLSGVISGVGGSLTKTSAGTLTLSGVNTYNSGTTITGGTLSVSAASNLSSGNVSIGGSGTLQSTGTFSVSNLISLNAGSTIDVTSGQDLTISSVISGVGGSLTKTSAGTLTLTGVNTYSGGTTITGGTLSVGTAGSLSTGNISIGGSGILQSTGTFSISNLISLNAGSTIDVASGQDLTISSVISGVGGSLTKTSAGTLTLSGVNTFSGGTAITNGTLSVSASGNLGTGNVSIGGSSILESTGTFVASNTVSLSAGSTIDVASGQNFTLNGSISGVGGSLTKTSAGTLTLAASNSYDSGTTITDGILSVSVLGALGSGNVSIAAISTLQSIGTFAASNTISLFAGSTIDVASGQNFTLSNTISGVGGSLTKTGTGTLTLSGANTYDSGTTITAGTVSVSSDGNLSSGSVSIGGSGTLQSTGTFSTSKAISIAASSAIDVTSGQNFTITSAISGALGSLTKTNSGTLTLTGANTYTGDTTIANGKLYVDGSLVSTTTTTVSPSGFLGGNGTVGNLHVKGTVSPGHSVGTLHANNVEFFTGSIYYVEVDGPLSDKIVATGNVVIDPSATLDVDPRLATAQIYPILTGSNVTGTFKPVDNLFPRFGIDVKYSPQEVDLIIVGGIPFPSILPKGDLKKIASCFELMVPDPSDDMLAILEVLDSLTLPELIDAFDQFNPGFFNAISFGEQSLSQRIREIYTEHAYSLQSPSCCGYDPARRGGGLWATVLLDQSRNNSEGHSRAYSGYNDKFIGFASGIDYLVREDLMLSTGFAFAKSHMDWTRTDAEAKFNSCNVTVSAAYAPDRFIFDTSFGWLYSPIHASRNILINPNETLPISIPPIDKKLSHRNFSNAYNAHLGGAYEYAYIVFKTIHLFLRPFFNLDYIHVHSSGYKEHGGGSLNMIVEAKNSELLRPELGLAFGMDCDISYFSNFDVQVSYIRENRFSGQKTNASFLMSESCAFDVKGLFPNRNLVSPTVKLGVCSTDEIHFDIEYRGLFGHNYAENELRFDFKACF